MSFDVLERSAGEGIHLYDAGNIERLSEFDPRVFRAVLLICSDPASRLGTSGESTGPLEGPAYVGWPWPWVGGATDQDDL